MMNMSQLKNINILYVEDDIALNDVLTKSIKLLITNVTNGFNGQDGLEKFKASINSETKKSEFDLIITDINMPKMNGLEMVKEIRNLGYDIPVIITSAYDDKDFLKESLKLNIGGFSTKPINVKILFETIQKLMEPFFLKNDLMTMNNTLEYQVKEKVKELQESKEKYYNLMSLSSEGIFVLSPKTGELLEHSKRVNDLLGYTDKELEKLTVLDWNKSLNNNIKEYQNIVDQLSYEQPKEFETIHTRKDGSTYIASISAVKITSNHEEFIYASVRDISKIKHKENEILKLNDALEKEKIKAEQANQTKSTFLSTMSHEIRTPLNAILGFVELLKEDNLSHKEKAEYIDIIDISSHNLLDIINDILDLSKIESGNMELDKVVFSPQKVVEDIQTLFQAKAKEKNITLSCECDTKIKQLFVNSDITKLKQIISNLIGNAIKFTPEYGVINSNITIKSQDDKKVVLRFLIKDSGVGIDKEKLATIFEPFKQEDQSTTREFGGTGLGLSIVKKMVDLMGGDIQVTSEKGNGTAFILSVPFELAEYNEEDSIQTTKHNYKYSGTVLVVDDVALNRKLLDIKLEKKGLKFIDACNGLEAIKIFEKEYQNISLIYLDINMPIMDGVEAVKIIKKFQEENNLNIPVIALTADAMHGMKEKYIAQGFDNYLVKPIDDTEFELSLEKYLFDNIQSDIVPTEIEDHTNEYYSIQDLANKLDIPLEFYTELIEEYLETVKENMKILKDSLSNKDYPVMKEVAHKLQGVSGNMGLEKLFEYFRLLEDGKGIPEEILLKIEEEYRKLEKI